MKSLKTYNLPQDVIEILKRQPNKSYYVANAVRAAHKGGGDVETDITDATDIELITELRLRFGLDDPKSEMLKAIMVLI
jgi:hypothetical protein